MQNFLLVVVVTFVIFLIGCSSKDKSRNDVGLDISTNICFPKKILENRYVAEKEYRRFVTDTTANLMEGEILIKDSKTLISIIEPILFDIYGKKTIKSERPYVYYLFGDDWIVMGSIFDGMKGGTFSIVINRKTCEVKGISHGC